MHSTLMKRGLPEAQGFSSVGVMNAVHELEMTDYEVHSLLICAKDTIFFEGHYMPYHRGVPHLLHSLTKVFTNLAIGFLVQEGRLSLNDQVVHFFPEYASVNSDDRVGRMTVKNLITMRNGHGRMISGNEWRPIRSSWIKCYFEEPVQFEPGQVFQYSSGNSYILSAIVQRITGRTTCDYLNERLFIPLGIGDVTWDISPDGVNPGGNGLSICAEDLAKIGVLFLNGGKWENRQIINEEWIRLSLGQKDRQPLPDGRSYGFHWWDLGFGYSANGAFGQTICIIPELNVVITMTAGTANSTEKALKTLYHGLQDAKKRFEENKAASEVSTVYGIWQSSRNILPRMDTWPGPIKEGHYDMEENPDGIREVSWQIRDSRFTFNLADQNGNHQIDCGIGEYIMGMTDMPGASLHHQYEFGRTMCCAGISKDENGSLLMNWFFPKTPFHDWVKLSFTDDTVRMERGTNVNSKETVRPVIEGKRITS